MSNGSKLRDLRLNSSYRDGLELDVAIVGAGTSGLYAAWRLQTGHGPGFAAPPRVQVFEMGDRVGGRLETAFLPDLAVAAELGGMRYMTSQKIVTTLIETVFQDDLTHVDFPMGAPDTSLIYLRKQQFRASAWGAAQQDGTKFQTRYYLNADDEGFSADQLFNKVIYDVLRADPWVMEAYGAKIIQNSFYDYSFELTARDWDDIKPRLRYNFAGPFEGMLVNDLGFWNLLKDQVSEEGYTFLDQAGAYYSNTINWNATEAFPYMVGDFSSADVSYRTIEGGYDLLAYALAYYYLQQEPSEIWIKNQLVRMGRPAEPGRHYELVFRNLDAGVEWKVYADQLILAMPRRSLELLAQNNPLLQGDEFTYHLESVIMEPSFKLMMAFETPWWKPLLNTTSGRAITDLPMRQCYYFGTDPSNAHSLFMACYDDMQTVTFWKALDDNHPERYEPRATRLMGLAALPPVALKHLASKVMVAEAMSQVRELHQVNTIPEPYVALYRDWADDPFGGGYHGWKAAYDVRRTMEYMRRPSPDEPLYVCGEAYSDQQGWVEGAFCVAEKMLQQYFRLERPDWLPASYYLGW